MDIEEEKMFLRETTRGSIRLSSAFPALCRKGRASKFLKVRIEPVERS